METVLEKSENREIPVSAELAEEARKWLEVPPPVIEQEKPKTAPERVRSVRYDLD